MAAAYGMSGTGLAHAAICLHTLPSTGIAPAYAMSGTDLAYDATVGSQLGGDRFALQPVVLVQHVRYEVADAAYGAISLSYARYCHGV
eukprot:3940745-Rhodomonas_salina.21